MGNKLLDKTPLLIPAVCLIMGIIVGEYIMAEIPLWPILAGVVVAAVLLWKFELLQSVAILLCFFVLGWLLIDRQKEKQDIVWPEGEVAYEAVVMSEPVEKSSMSANEKVCIFP